MPIIKIYRLILTTTSATGKRKVPEPAVQESKAEVDDDLRALPGARTDDLRALLHEVLSQPHSTPQLLSLMAPPHTLGMAPSSQALMPFFSTTPPGYGMQSVSPYNFPTFPLYAQPAFQLQAPQPVANTTPNTPLDKLLALFGK